MGCQGESALHAGPRAGATKTILLSPFGDEHICSTTSRGNSGTADRSVGDEHAQPHAVRSTQRHRESWRWTPRGWRIYLLQELGGSIWVDGQLQPSG